MELLLTNYLSIRDIIALSITNKKNRRDITLKYPIITKLNYKDNLLYKKSLSRLVPRKYFLERPESIVLDTNIKYIYNIGKIGNELLEVYICNNLVFYSKSCNLLCKRIRKNNIDVLVSYMDELLLRSVIITNDNIIFI